MFYKQFPQTGHIVVSQVQFLVRTELRLHVFNGRLAFLVAATDLFEHGVVFVNIVGDSSQPGPGLPILRALVRSSGSQLALELGWTRLDRNMARFGGACRREQSAVVLRSILGVGVRAERSTFQTRGVKVFAFGWLAVGRVSDVGGTSAFFFSVHAEVLCSVEWSRCGLLQALKF